MLHEVKTMINRAKMFIHETDKATHQRFTWIAVSSFILFYRSRDNMQLKTAQLTFVQYSTRNEEDMLSLR